jgi:hypothetical protein
VEIAFAAPGIGDIREAGTLRRRVARTTMRSRGDATRCGGVVARTGRTTRPVHAITTAGGSRMRKLLVMLGLAAIVGCDDDSTGPTAEGRLRIVHGVANVTLTDVLVGTGTVKTDLAYRGIVSVPVRAGTWPVKVRKADATADLVSVSREVEDDDSYTIVAYGTEAQPKSMVLTDDLALPAAGKAKLRAAHAADGRGNVDVYVVEAAADLATATAVATNVAPGAASTYATVDADTYVVILTAAGTRNAVLTVEDVELASGRVQTVVAVDKAGGGTPLEAVSIVDR